jgi:hypothetical protein
MFVYCDFKSGHADHPFLDGSVFLGDGHTTTQFFVMERSDYGPVAFRSSNLSAAGHRLMGEVYLVKPKTILSTDKARANNEMFKREKVFVYLLDQQVKPGIRMKPSLQCWTYMGVESFWVEEDTKSMQSKEVGTQRVYEWNDPVERSFFEDYEMKRFHQTMDQMCH